MTEEIGEDIVRYQAFCIEVQSPCASFVLWNGRGFACCQWIDPHLGLFRFNTGEAMHVESVPKMVRTFLTLPEAERAVADMHLETA